MNLPPTLPLAPKKLINSSDVTKRPGSHHPAQSNCRKAVGGKTREAPGALGYRLIAPPTGHLPRHTHARGGQETRLSSLTICGSASSQIPLLHPADTCPPNRLQKQLFCQPLHHAMCRPDHVQMKSSHGPLSVLSVSPACLAFAPCPWTWRTM